MNRWEAALVLAVLLPLVTECGVMAGARKAGPQVPPKDASRVGRFAVVDDIGLRQSFSGRGEAQGEAFRFQVFGWGEARLETYMAGGKARRMTGTISRTRFVALAALLEREHFWKMPPYTNGISERAVITVSVERGGKAHHASVQGSAGPPGFDRLVQALRVERARIVWKPVVPSQAARWK